MKTIFLWVLPLIFFNSAIKYPVTKYKVKTKTEYYANTDTSKAVFDYEYDSLGRVKSINRGEKFSTIYRYTDDTVYCYHITPDNTKVTIYKLNSTGHVTSEDGVAFYNYDRNGNLKKREIPNYMITRYYSSRGNTSKLIQKEIGIPTTKQIFTYYDLNETRDYGITMFGSVNHKLAKTEYSTLRGRFKVKNHSYKTDPKTFATKETTKISHEKFIPLKLYITYEFDSLGRITKKISEDARWGKKNALITLYTYF